MDPALLTDMATVVAETRRQCIPLPLTEYLLRSSSSYRLPHSNYGSRTPLYLSRHELHFREDLQCRVPKTIVFGTAT